MTDLVKELWETVFLAALAYIVLWIAWRKQFFHRTLRDVVTAPINLSHVVTVFAIYFGSVFFFIVPLQKICGALFQWLHISSSTLHFSVAVHFSLSLLIACLLALFFFMLQPETRRIIWRQFPKESSYKQDILIALLAWPISYPVLLCVSQVLDLLTYLLFHVRELPDQTAVHFLKMTIDQPFSFLLNMITIIFMAPFIEEIIFRGFLQTYIRKFFRPAGAIALSSFCFACFHFSPEQGLGNIPLIGSLWAFALFLGFVYERQGSLLSPICLHGTFNALSVLNVYFFCKQTQCF